MDLQAVVQGLVADNYARIFPPAQGPAEILGVELGSRRFIREDRFHHILLIRYRVGHKTRSLRLWLKFRPQIDTLLPILEAYNKQLSRRIFPQPYFAWHSSSNNAAFLATAYIAGTLLRNRLLLRALLGRAGDLEPLFHSSGSKMRCLHDAFPPSGALAVADVVESTLGLVRTTSFLSNADKAVVLSQTERLAAGLTMEVLPTVRIHGDWILRNIIIAEDGTDYVVDCDSMRQGNNLRWFDIGYSLLNMESQMKWHPLITKSALSKLWSAFWRGYNAETGPPDGLQLAQVNAVLYLVRLQYLLGGTTRGPLIKTLEGPFMHRFLQGVRQTLIVGHCSQLSFLNMDS